MFGWPKRYVLNVSSVAGNKVTKTASERGEREKLFLEHLSQQWEDLSLKAPTHGLTQSYDAISG